MSIVATHVPAHVLHLPAYPPSQKTMLEVDQEGEHVKKYVSWMNLLGYFLFQNQLHMAWINLSYHQRTLQPDNKMWKHE